MDLPFLLKDQKQNQRKIQQGPNQLRNYSKKGRADLIKHLENELKVDRKRGRPPRLRYPENNLS